MAPGRMSTRCCRDQPPPMQYLKFLWGAVRFQFGYSYQDPGETITALLART
jgi:ABC-type dipeptide/oligopeptide/nickel transport system permease component